MFAKISLRAPSISVGVVRSKGYRIARKAREVRITGSKIRRVVKYGAMIRNECLRWKSSFRDDTRVGAVWIRTQRRPNLDTDISDKGNAGRDRELSASRMEELYEAVTSQGAY